MIEMKARLENGKHQLLLRRIFLLVYDCAAVCAADLFALMLRFDSFQKIQVQFLDSMWEYLPIQILVTLAVFYIFRMYHSLWGFAGITEMQNTIVSCILSAILQFLGMQLAGKPYPRSCQFFYGVMLLLLVLISRFMYRFIRVTRSKYSNNKKNTMIIGAGSAADIIIKEIINSNYIDNCVKCIIDDDKNKIGNYVHGIRIVGDRNAIVESAEKYQIDEIILAIPSASRKTIRELAMICQKTPCKLKTLPGIYQLVNGEVGVNKLRNVEVEDLLGREPVQVNLDSIMEYVLGKVVLVSGGGGSIGSELCRQIADNGARQLIIVDIYENNAYDIQQELKKSHPELDLVVLIASVRNTNRMNSIFEKYRPDIVYHAAAHKHVPLMEDSPNEAIKNNVFGTLKIVQAADRFGVARFVMISTDKAVNPTNIMGASKRMCEMIIQAYNRRSQTEFVAVRFGNVLGSNGSVIPLFKKQIEQGGPVTVTHPDIIRYFMTIPEAVSLVLQAGAYAKGGEIFVLDMGEPVKILDLAYNLIRLSGYTPGVDIEVKFTGLRPGEKLYEEMLMEEEGLQDTENHLIHIGKPMEFDEDKYFRQLEILRKMVKEEMGDVRAMVKEIVPTYHPEEGVRENVSEQR